MMPAEVHVTNIHATANLFSAEIEEVLSLSLPRGGNGGGGGGGGEEGGGRSRFGGGGAPTWPLMSAMQLLGSVLRLGPYHHRLRSTLPCAFVVDLLRKARLVPRSPVPRRPCS